MSGIESITFGMPQFEQAQRDHGPTHIKSVEEIQVGKPYLRRYEGVIPGVGMIGGVEEIIFTDLSTVNIHQPLEGQIVLVRNRESVEPEEASLSDLGLAPYGRGWVATTWLEDPARENKPD